MKLTDIKRPENLNLNEHGIKMEVFYPNNMYDEQGELADIFIAPILVTVDEKGSDDIFEVPIDEKLFDNEIFLKFNQLTYSIGKMVRLAEHNLDLLIGVFGLYLQIYPLDEILERNADCKNLKQYDIENNFHKLTFGTLRNILSCIIKSDLELQGIEGLETSETRKNFTTVYQNYIEDRDYYTHGILFFLYPTFEPVLRVKGKKGEMDNIKISKEVFTDNLKTYNYLTKALNEMREILQNKITPAS